MELLEKWIWCVMTICQMQDLISGASLIHHENLDHDLQYEEIARSEKSYNVPNHNFKTDTQRIEQIDSRYIIPPVDKKRMYSSKAYYIEPIQHTIPKKHWSPRHKNKWNIRHFPAQYNLKADQTSPLTAGDSDPHYLKMNVNGYQVKVVSVSKTKHFGYNKENDLNSQEIPEISHEIEIIPENYVETPIDTPQKHYDTYTENDRIEVSGSHEESTIDKQLDDMPPDFLEGSFQKSNATESGLISTSSLSVSADKEMYEEMPVTVVSSNLRLEENSVTEEDGFDPRVFEEGSGESEDPRSLQEDTKFGDSEVETLAVADESNDEEETKLKSSRVVDIFLRSNTTSTACTTPSGEVGRCQPLTECLLSDALNNFSLFLQYLCLMRGPFVGICCPDNPVIEISDGDDITDSTPQEFKQPDEGCGQNSNLRIIGGTMSIPHEWTWMVALMRRNRFFCGGVIINDWYILTAAHCVLGIKVKDLTVRLGEYNFMEKNEHQEDIPIAEIKRHAQFITLTFQHDIALLKLKRKVEYSKFIGSICLPDRSGRDFTEVNATVVGWGTVSFGGAASPVLRQVTIPVWTNEECDKTYKFESITDSFLCAGSPENEKDACQGDSGGPLMALNDNGRWEVIGIVSWGRRCGDPTYPGVYTRITTYIDWITENIQ